MLSKLGWNKGEALGKANDGSGLLEPVCFSSFLLRFFLLLFLIMRTFIIILDRSMSHRMRARLAWVVVQQLRLTLGLPMQISVKLRLGRRHRHAINKQIFSKTTMIVLNVSNKISSILINIIRMQIYYLFIIIFPQSNL